jgi:hypothetical protein
MGSFHLDLENYGVSIDIESRTCTGVDDALAKELAPVVFGCAMSYALAALMCDDEWTKIAVEELAALMQQYRAAIMTTPTIQ